MSDRSYSHLHAQAQQTIDAWCEDYESMLRQKMPCSLEDQLRKVEIPLRGPLLLELLPMEIEAIRTRSGQLPTLRELTLAHPQLAKALPRLYSRLPADLRVPDAFGAYRVLKVLSEGGQSRIVKARDEDNDDRLVAIKYNRTPEHIDLVRQEMRFLKELSHKNIVSLIDAREAPPYFYLVLPYLRGENLQDAYSQVRPAPHVAAQILLQVVEAVAHMHEHRIVHGDIKPANIHANPAQPVESVQLIDLGMAVDVDRWSLPNGPLRSPGGTEPYMPPEQLAEVEQADGRLCDIYSLGGVLFFLLTGEPPYDPISASRGLRATKAPRVLKEIAHRALAANPAERIVSAREMAGQLQQYLAQQALMQKARKLATPLVPAAVIGLVMLAMGSFRTLEYLVSYMPATSQLLEKTADDLGIDLKAVQAKDLRLSVVPNEGYGGAHFLSLEGAIEFPALLHVDADSPLKELLSNVEVRIGKQPWRNFLIQPQNMEKKHYAMLTAKDVNSGGPVQLRLDSIGGVGVGKVFGPYTYELDLLEEFKACQLKKKDKVSEDWGRSPLPWIDHVGMGWELQINQFLFPWTPVKQLILRSASVEGETVVNFMDAEPDPNNPLEQIVGYPRLKSFDSAQQAFRGAAKPHNQDQTLIVQMVFFDGTTSLTRGFINRRYQPPPERRPVKQEEISSRS